MKTIKLASLKPNPDNPRYITEDKFEALKLSIRDFPEMMALRPLVVDDQGTVLGGNMRLKALAELGYQDIPAAWVIKAKDLTEEQRREFVVKDNIGFGAWDWDALSNEWADAPLGEWGIDTWAAPDPINMDQFFSDEPNKSKEGKHLVVLQYDKQRYKVVIKAFADAEGKPEDIVFRLLTQ